MATTKFQSTFSMQRYSTKGSYKANSITNYTSCAFTYNSLLSTVEAACWSTYVWTTKSANPCSLSTIDIIKRGRNAQIIGLKYIQEQFTKAPYTSIYLLYTCVPLWISDDERHGYIIELHSITLHKRMMLIIKMEWCTVFMANRAILWLLSHGFDVCLYIYIYIYSCVTCTSMHCIRS